MLIPNDLPVECETRLEKKITRTGDIRLRGYGRRVSVRPRLKTSGSFLHHGRNFPSTRDSMLCRFFYRSRSFESNINTSKINSCDFVTGRTITRAHNLPLTHVSQTDIHLRQQCVRRLLLFLSPLTSTTRNSLMKLTHDPQRNINGLLSVVLI
jgi:hypothetical protein